MKDTNTCGLVYGSDEHHLDHIAPLCHLLDIPLVVTERKMEALAKKFYPEVVVHWCKTLDYDVFYSCLPRPFLESILFVQKHLLRKTFQSIWVPHGSSDKGGFSGLDQEHSLLVYGQKMACDIKASGIEAKLTEVGNYRYAYYKKMKPFYDGLLECKKETILFAPSWNDQEGPSTFFTALPQLVKRLGNDFILLVKPHPNFVKQEPLRFEQIRTQLESKRVRFLTEFPVIYPLLDHVDRYVGDTSSIGYDMLAFEKPMFFLNHKQQNLYLHQTGKVLTTGEYDSIFDSMDIPVKAIQETYAYTFGELS